MREAVPESHSTAVSGFGKSETLPILTTISLFDYEGCDLSSLVSQQQPFTPLSPCPSLTDPCIMDSLILRTTAG